MSQQFCLKWNNHMNNMMDVFKNLLSTEAMVDVTLACDGLSLKAHKIVLSACSPFFQSLFLENPCKHPIVILKDMKYTELKAIIEFMYHGEVNVAQDQLSALMKTAETLRVKGLAEVTNEKSSSGALQDDSTHRSVPRTDTPPPKRKKARTRKRSLSDSNRSEDESNEPSIVGRPDSPEIEELSNDVTMDNTQYSNMQSQVPTQILPSHPSNSFHKTIDSVDDSASIDDSFVQEEKFRVEPAKLLEQTLTTDDLPSRRSGRSSVQSNLEMQRRPRSSTDHSTSLVHASMSNEALGSNQQPESPPDIKPELLELDPPLSSPVAGPSHGTDDSMMMYMDPGPSGYQDNSQALVPADNQQQDIFCSKCQLSIKNDFSSGLGEKLFNKDSFNTAPLASNQKVPHLSLLEPPNKSGAVEFHQEIKFMVQTAESNPYVPQEKQNESCKVNSRNNCPLDYSKPVDYSMKLTISELNSKTKSDNLFGHLLDDIPLEDTRKNERESKPKESFELEKIETNSDKDHYVKNRIASAETAQNVCSMFENEAVQYPEICGKKDYKIDEIETDGVAITFPSVAVKIEDEFIDISAEHVVNDSTSIQIESSFSARIKSEPSSPISVSVNSEAVQNPRTELESEIYHSEPNSKAVSSLPETCEIGSIFAVLDSEINENQTTKLNSSEACKMLRIELVRCDTVKDVSISCSGSTEKVNKTAAKTHGKLKNVSYVKGKKDAKSKIVKSKSKKKNSKISHVVERDSFGANVKESKDDLNKNNTNARKKQLKLDNKGKIAKKKLDNGKNKKKNETKGSKEKYGNAKKVGDIESIPVKPIPASKSTTIDECPTNFGVVPNHGETALNHEAKSILPNDEKMVYSTKEIDKTLPSGSSNFYNSGMFSIPYTLSGVISSTESDQSTNTLLGNKKQTLAVQKPLKRTYSNFSSKKRKERDCHGYTRIKPKNTDILAPMPVESTTKSCSTISFTVSESLFNGKREKVKVYKCNLCECAFERKYDQLQHALRHTQQSQLLNCNLCTYTTQEELHLERHVTVVHKNTPCDVTDVVF